ncbi:hypothetical protein NL108_017201 [Boleophthalmus pectinirostris]|nr:hypothetical protein NL108_017201 [Boleophthalmus pectinirostris]
MLQTLYIICVSKWAPPGGGCDAAGHRGRHFWLFLTETRSGNVAAAKLELDPETLKVKHRAHISLQQESPNFFLWRATLSLLTVMRAGIRSDVEQNSLTLMMQIIFFEKPPHFLYIRQTARSSH